MKYTHLVKCEMYRNSNIPALFILRCQQPFKSLHLEKSRNDDKQKYQSILLISVIGIKQNSNL